MYAKNNIKVFLKTVFFLGKDSNRQIGNIKSLLDDL